MANFTILKDYCKNVKKFNLKSRTIEFKINSIPKNKHVVAWIHQAISDVILYATADVEPSDKVGFTFCCKDFKSVQGWKSYNNLSEVTVNDVLCAVTEKFQFNSTGLNTNTFCLCVTTVTLPVGMGNNTPNK